MQRNTAELHYIVEKDSLSLCDLGGVCVNLRETYYFCANCLSTLECCSPADSADDAEECSKLYYFAEKDSLILCGLVGASQISVRLIIFVQIA